MIRIDYSTAAMQDLEQIGDYISVMLKSPMAALNTVGKIQDAIDKLTDFPCAGTLLSSIIQADVDYRVLVCGNYLAFYRTESDRVFIDRILHSKQNYVKILFTELPE